MRFVVDECVGPTVARWLANQGHEVFSVYDQARSSTDEEILAKSHQESWIIVTNDRDFGALVFRERKAHSGIIFFRLDDETPNSIIRALDRILRDHASQLAGRFVVVTETHIRFART